MEKSKYSVIEFDGQGQQVEFEMFDDPTTALGYFESAAQEFGARAKVFKDGVEMKHAELLDKAELDCPGIKELRANMFRQEMEQLK